MRDILFRAKLIDQDEWIEGFLILHGESVMMFSVRGFPYGTGTFHVDPNTVGQFTGLTDKNGKKIFEGDIIDASDEWWDAAGYAGHNSPIIIVEWNNRECGFAPFSTYDSNCGVSINAMRCEVIGNIYDNPEIEWCD